MSKIWHCPADIDKQLAEIMVGSLGSRQWKSLSDKYHKNYPVTMADKYDLVHRMLGCKTSTPVHLHKCNICGVYFSCHDTECNNCEEYRCEDCLNQYEKKNG